MKKKKVKEIPILETTTFIVRLGADELEMFDSAILKVSHMSRAAGLRAVLFHFVHAPESQQRQILTEYLQHRTVSIIKEKMKGSQK
jgi:hypothetical protein